MIGLGRLGVGVQPVDDETAFRRLVDSLRYRESSGGKPLVSPKGALGSLQLMPGTADEVLAQLGRHDVLALEPAERYRRVRHDTELNEQLGQEYLRRQLKEFGHPALAVAAYNAGGGNVRSWLRRHGDPRKGEVSWDAWVSRIPFGETRRLVKRVLAGAGLPVAAPAVPEPKPGTVMPEPTVVPELPLLVDRAPSPETRINRAIGVPEQFLAVDPFQRLLRRA